MKTKTRAKKKAVKKNELTAEERLAARRAIARDVLKLQELNVLKSPHQSGYVKVSRGFPRRVAAEGSMKPYVRDTTCEVCALGGLFVGMVDRFNQCSVGEFAVVSRDSIFRKLTPYFTRRELNFIEACYEGLDTPPHSSRLYPLETRVLINSFYLAHKPAERLRRICRVIARDGEFDLVAASMLP